jgi:putative ABC transport system permease protein
MNGQIHPPEWATRFLEWYCDPRVLDEVQGDLYEAFYERVERHGPKKARIQYVKEVILSVNSRNRKKRYSSIQFGMWNNYLKIGLRNFSKQRLYSFINVFGLALGISCVILITLFVLNEKSFDRFHDRASTSIASLKKL